MQRPRPVIGAGVAIWSWQAGGTRMAPVDAVTAPLMDYSQLAELINEQSQLVPLGQ